RPDMATTGNAAAATTTPASRPQISRDRAFESRLRSCLRIQSTATGYATGVQAVFRCGPVALAVRPEARAVRTGRGSGSRGRSSWVGGGTGQDGRSGGTSNDGLTARGEHHKGGRTQMGMIADWPSMAACRNGDPDALFVQGAEQNVAKRICRSCPVRYECLADALDNRIEFGVWGGMTERERRALLRRHPQVASCRRTFES